LQCQAELTGLLGDIAQVAAMGQPLPPFDVHWPLMSLPLAFKTDLRSIPRTTPYLKPDTHRVTAWSRRLGSSEGRMRIGLVWSGNPSFRGNPARSLSLRQLRDVAAVGGVTFYSLQKGPAAAEAKQPPAGMRLIDLGAELHDFGDTAAVMSLLDLIVSTDTSAAHLAGALARPVWVMLQYAADWRWMLDREDSPWYPTMRLFRQPSFGDWETPIRKVVETLLRKGMGKGVGSL
jgi:hypothetical protein